MIEAENIIEVCTLCPGIHDVKIINRYDQGLLVVETLCPKHKAELKESGYDLEAN